MQQQQICPGVWHLEEDYRVYCTLVIGTTAALLWDTGQGKQDLAAAVAARTALPCLVCCSHGHSDHVGGAFRFPQVWLHPADWPLLEAQARMTGRPCSARPLTPGQRFPLGGRTAQVVPLAGHTQGSVGLLLEGEDLLLAGDALNPTLLLLGPEAAPLAQLRQTLTAVADLPFSRYLSSHAPAPLPKAQAALHLHHLDHLHTEAPSHPGPYGPRVVRSTYREGGRRSVILFDRGLLPPKKQP